MQCMYPPRYTNKALTHIYGLIIVLYRRAPLAMVEYPPFYGLELRYRSLPWLQ